MQKKPLDKIKIQEIADESGVNRQTFYYHFEDVYSLLKWTIISDAKQIVAKNADSDNYISVVTDVYEYIGKNKSVFLNIMNSKACEYFVDVVQNLFYEGMRNVIDNLKESEGVSDFYKDFIAQFYANAINGISFTWLKYNSVTQMSPSELVKMIDLVATGNIKRSLLKCREI